MLTLIADLGRCRCGRNLVDDALKHSWIVLSNSKIKSGGHCSLVDFAENGTKVENPF